MPTVAARLRIRNAADTADLVVFGMNDLSAFPEGDGTQVNIITGQLRSGSYVVRILDNLALTAVLNDSFGRPQLKSRRAFVEVQTNGGAWEQRVGGYVTRVTIRDGYDAEIEVGEALRLPGTALVPSVALAATLIRGAIVGGPATTNWGALALTRGGWACTVTAVSGRRVTVEITSAYAPPANTVHTSSSLMIQDVAAVERVLAPFASDGVTNVEYGGISPVNANAPKLSARLTRVSDSQVTNGTPRVVLVGSFLNTTQGTPVFTFSGTGILHTMDVPTGEPLPSVSDVMRLVIFSANVSAFSPVYFAAHPIALAKQLYESIGVVCDATSFTAVQNAIGTQLRYAERVTEPFAVQPWIERNISGPLGVAFLPDTAGVLSAVYVRAPLTALPSTTITLDDVSAIETLWDDAEDNSIAMLTYEQSRYTLIGTPTADDPADAVLTDRLRQELTIDSGNTYATRTISYEVDGQYYLEGQWPGTSDTLSGVQRAQLAQRYGRGAPETTLRVRRDSTVAASLALGTYVRNSVPSLPSGTARLATQAGVTRVQQITRITEDVGERVLLLEDTGVVSGTVSLVPTLSITSTGNFYTVTITNLAALQAALLGIRLEVALTSGGAPASTDWTPLASYVFANVATVTGSVAFTPVTVHVRARSEQGSSFPSAWSTSVSTSIAGLAGVTSLAAAAVTGDGSSLAITWVRTLTDFAVFDVYVRLASSPQGTGIASALVPAGGQSVTLSGLAASTLYTVDVRARSSTFFDVSAWSTTTATTDSASATLAVPTSVVASTGGYAEVIVQGAVSGSPIPSVDVDMATETGVGTGAFGSYVNRGEFAAGTSGAFTITFEEATNGRKRRLRVRAVRTGATSSAYVVATPDVIPPSGGGML